MTTAECTDLVGRVLGRVRLDAVLGEGAAGIVFRGRHLTLDKDVAVKVLKDCGTLRDDRYRDRFRREARIAASIDHPSIVRVLDFGEEAGQLYLIMEFVDGYPVSRYLRNKPGPVEEMTALKVLVAVGQALQVAHSMGIVHRDLKPDNLLLSRTGKLKIADLGLAKQLDSTGLTMEHQIVGSPSYMAPETFTPGLDIDHRVDIYALGIIGYRLVFGTLPYRGEVAQILGGHREGCADWSGPTSASKPLLAVIRRLMLSNRDERYQSAEEMLADLQPILQQRRRKQPRSTTASGSGAHASQSGWSGEFASVVRFLENRLGGRVTEHRGGRVVHTTGRERLVVWVMLVGIIAVAVGAYLAGKT